MAALGGGTDYLSSEVSIDEATLIQIAQLTNGKYFRATDAEALRAIYGEIDRLEKAGERRGQQPTSRFMRRSSPLALAFLLLEVVLVTTRLRTILDEEQGCASPPGLPSTCSRWCPGCSCCSAKARRRRQTLAAFVAQELAPRALPAEGERRGWGGRSVWPGAAACFVLALMQPEWGAGGQDLGCAGAI